MRIRFSDEGIARARALVADYPDERIKSMYVEGLLRLAGDDRAERTQFPPHTPGTDTCRCRACFEACFEIIRGEYRHRFGPAGSAQGAGAGG